MGTRSLVGYTLKGVTAFQYIQYDGYLAGRGAEFLSLVAGIAERTLKSIHHPLTPEKAKAKALAAIKSHMALMELETPHSWANNGKMPSEKFFTKTTWANYWVEFVRILDLDRNEAVFYGSNPNEVLLRLPMQALATLASDASVYDLKEYVFNRMEDLRGEPDSGDAACLGVQTGMAKGQDWLVITLNGQPVLASHHAPEHLRKLAQVWRDEAIDRRHAERVKRARDLVKAEDEPAVTPLAAAV